MVDATQPTLTRRRVCWQKFAELLRVLVLVTVASIVLAMTHQRPLIANPRAVTYSHTSFVEVLLERADPDRYILLAMTDEGFVDMAINFYEASLRPHHIDNFLFVGVGNRTCDLLSRRMIPCFYYADDPSAGESSSYRQRDFIRKMNIRTDMILEALAANFTVIHTDVDMAILNNPLVDIKAVMTRSDLAALLDSNAYNAGFIVIKPSPLGERVYRIVRNITSKSSRTDDQQALNVAIRIVKQLKTGINATVLDKRRYMSGVQYFENMKRLLPKPDDECSSPGKTNCSVFVVHNNWIVTKEAKVYRFREHHMWLHDGDDQYYSSQNRKYLTYTNSKFEPKFLTGNLSSSMKKESAERQMSGLKTALAIGYLLNRTVILPRFHSSKVANGHPLNGLIHMKTFDAQFSGQYRENSFLQHPNVPNNVKHGAAGKQLAIHPQVAPATKSYTISGEKVMTLFRDLKDKVVDFGILDGIQVQLNNSTFEQKIRLAFRFSDYRQLHPGDFL